MAVDRNGNAYVLYDTSEVFHVSMRTLQYTYTFRNLPQNNGWAFGAWGGDFHLFTAPGNLTNGAQSLITRYRPSTGSQTTVATLGETIVGAGVSTCAPQM